MGGGDLNLKKSWHPSTMKNMEKVWKAEKMDHQEKKRIAELRREIEMEKDREEIKKFAMDHGSIEKKEDKKLDWMYKQPNQSINREDYLLGKKIDSNFETTIQSEKDAALNRAPKNHVEHECIPPSLRFFSGNDHVDLARKQQEDPLFLIKRKEIETRAQLLNNPIKMKEIQQMLKEEKKNKEKQKEKKLKKRKNYSESDSDKELDNLLAAKYKKLKDKIDEEDLIKNVKKKKHEKKRSRRDDSTDSDSNSESETERKRKKSERKSRKRKRDESSDSESPDRKLKRKKKKRNSSDSEERISRKKEKKGKKRRNKSSDSEEKSNKIVKEDSQRDSSERRPVRNFGLMTADGTKIAINPRSYSPDRLKISKRTEEKDKKWIPPKRQKLSEEEKERRRLEMMENAVWREKDREEKVRRHREEAKKEEESTKSFSKDFLRKQLAAAVEVGTLESRVKSRKNNIQRSNQHMNTNFARRHGPIRPVVYDRARR